MQKHQHGERSPAWAGDYLFLFENLILKDFRIRYRNMSLGLFWSLLNPLMMMAVLYFVFTKLFPNPGVTSFPICVLCGLVPFSFFNVAVLTSTTSIIDNAPLVKRVPVPREIIPIASVLSNCVHLLIQVTVLLTIVIVFGIGINRHWVWLPVVWGLEVVFVCGIAMALSSLNVFIRDTRYIVEAGMTVLFWFVPIFYPFSIIPQQYKELYQFNPVAALVLALRNVLLEGVPPPVPLLIKLAVVSALMFIAGFAFFRRSKAFFYEHL